MKKWLLLLIGCLLSFISMANPLPGKDVFQVSISHSEPDNFTLNWQIKPGYFLYRDKIALTLPNNAIARLGELRFPKPYSKTDRQHRTWLVYHSELTLPVTILAEQAGEMLLDLHYQGCADDGFCYPPVTRPIKLSINPDMTLASVEFYNDKIHRQTTQSIQITNTAESIFTSHNHAVVLLVFFGFGLLLAFTPCILPMVPVLSGIIIGHGHNISTQKAFFLSLSYVLSMAITYAIAGAMIALLGSNIQIIMQSPWAISLFSLLFVLLSLSMFGWFELKLPLSWQAALARINRKQHSGHYLSAAIMGCLSTLILSPCVTAPLIGVLGYIAHDGNVFMGALSLFFLSLGMGTPLILIGTSAGRWLPKAGSWMTIVKSFFGVLLLAVAISLMARILPDSIIMSLWAMLLIFSGLFARPLVSGTTQMDIFRQGTGIILLVYGLLILIGASMGNTNPLQPLAISHSSVSIASRDTPIVNTIKGVQTAMTEARGKLVMLDFYADWCASCKIMDATTLKNQAVMDALQNVVRLKVDITANNPETKALMRKYHIIAPPTFLFFNINGDELLKARLVGDTNSQEFLTHINQQVLNTQNK